MKESINIYCDESCHLKNDGKSSKKKTDGGIPNLHKSQNRLGLLNGFFTPLTLTTLRYGH